MNKFIKFLGDLLLEIIMLAMTLGIIIYIYFN
jgi:hypothetical protein